MNIKHYLSAAAALALFAACSDYDPGMSEKAVDLTDAEIKTIQEYTANFVERYGEMDPNHTWGFGELAEMEEMGTRAVQVDRNNWTVRVNQDGEMTVLGTIGTYKQNQWNPNVYNYDYEDKIGWTIPGFPSVVDGHYYYEKNGARYQKTEEEINTWSANQGSLNEGSYQIAQLEPIGDVTDEEIQYVSWWFRTHPRPQSVVPPFTEFFMQDVSQDNDRNSYPDGTWKYPDYYNMDYFSVKTSDNYWEHINNFNEGKANPISEDAPADANALHNDTQEFANRTMKYWSSAGPYERGVEDVINRDGSAYTTSFSYHNSDDSKDYENYVLVHLSFDGPRTGLHYDGYYLAFDYEMHKDPGTVNPGEITDIPRDGYYSNWIVKLSPANPDFYTTKTVTLERRVMCEDLGSTFDFDFNDLVFDVKYEQKYKKVNGEWVLESDYAGGLWDATITLQAVGGTLPIYITDFNGIEHDAHQLMGGTLSSNGTYSPVNVGTGPTHDPVTLDIVRRVASTNPDNIVIRVTSPDKNRSDEADKASTMILPTAYGAQSGAQSFGTIIAPQKICVPVDTRWTKEYQQIEWAYPHFAEWVTNQNGAAGFGKESDWTTTGVVESYLYP